MTREEAINRIKEMEEFDLLNVNASCYQIYEKALDMAIEALQWQDRILTQIEDMVPKEHGERREP